ncbi:putative beta-hexosaminidase alpha chain [Coleophoma cylindrospora]|uniref:Beta-hexosaminidase n=1 Tax=Coleophoma cylindrospora TaxID=1849047 RepID=A0A3D8SFE7_9HELO|nr:putative beta-hexosaminidase alpha chain [Coleophoma cylindrospora]
MWLSIVWFCAFFSFTQALWPVPVEFTSGNTVLWIAPNVKVTYNGGNVRWSPQTYDKNGQTENVWIEQLTTNTSAYTSHSIIEAAVTRTLKTVFTQNLVPWKLHPRNELYKFEPAANSTKTYISSLTITQTGTDTVDTFKPLAGAVDESYNLTITEDGKAVISGVSSTGILHGLQTFSQLFYQHSTDAGIYINMAPVAISDAPKFSHRGLNIDISRNWYPVSSITKTIDALSWNKFNRLHLHMTDAQSWPMDVPALPELSKKGAYQVGLSYSPADIAYIQSYAQSRGIEVIIEIDMPGHTSVIGLAYPELIAAQDAQPWDTYCAEPPCGQLKLNSSAVDTFLETLFDDILPRVYPYSAYFHTGGDEVNVQDYLLDETVQSNLTSVLKPLLQKFLDRNHDQIRSKGLTPIVWEEMLNTWNLTLGDDVLVQTWGVTPTSVHDVVAAGHKVLFGDSSFWYLDCGKGQWLDFTNESFQTYYPFADYCSPTKNWRLVYSYDPTANMTAEELALVAGGEVHLWSEQTDPVSVEYMLWPRASAAGEILWSGRQDASGQNRSQLDASPRLAELRERMVNRGVAAGPVQMVFCTQHNATECSL